MSSAANCSKGMSLPWRIYDPQALKQCVSLWQVSISMKHKQPLMYQHLV